MQPFLTLLAALRSGSTELWWLDAAQLIKHSLALSAQAAKLDKLPALLYVYADPAAWPDGRSISVFKRAQHAEQLDRFARAIEGAEVQFAAATYRQMLNGWIGGNELEVQEHARAVASHFHIDVLDHLATPVPKGSA